MRNTMNTDNLTEFEKEIFSDIEKWDTRELGADEDFVKISTVSPKLKEVLDIQGGEKTKPVSIRMPVSLVNDLKMIGKQQNLGYQTLIKDVLQRFVDAECRKNYNKVVSEKIALEKEVARLRLKQAQTQTA